MKKPSASSATLWPESARFPARQGIIYAKKKLFTEADLFISRALDLDPQEIDALYGMGLLKKETGDPAGALRYLDKVIELNPDHQLAHWTLAMSYLHLGQKENARHHFQRAKDLGLIIPETIIRGLTLEK